MSMLRGMVGGLLLCSGRVERTGASGGLPGPRRLKEDVVLRRRAEELEDRRAQVRAARPGAVLPATAGAAAAAAVPGVADEIVVAGVMVTGALGMRPLCVPASVP
mmetsp:Transcript_39156/g.87133  ORF Transcript_39156/g.87133 Transcript_39156/m.87133 type:complete len:105 (+) Transcript_39156:183-497(+)